MVIHLVGKFMEKKIKSNCVDSEIHRRQSQQIGYLKDRDNPGPSRIITLTDDHLLQLTRKQHCRKAVLQAASEFSCRCQHSISVTAIKHRLMDQNLHDSLVIREPLLRQDNRLKKLQWARQHRDWRMEQKDNVL
ncbi:hypothetical protein Trydic_g9571 [Trypoxylus dichotomus]